MIDQPAVGRERMPHPLHLFCGEAVARGMRPVRSIGMLPPTGQSSSACGVDRRPALGIGEYRGLPRCVFGERERPSEVGVCLLYTSPSPRD